MVKVLRTEIIEVLPNVNLGKLCHLTKNLYNRANYLIKEEKKKGIVLVYFDLDKLLKGEECYKLLPAHTAQHTLKLLSRNWKAYIQAMKDCKKYPNTFFNKPHPPRFKRPKA